MRFTLAFPEKHTVAQNSRASRAVAQLAALAVAARRHVSRHRVQGLVLALHL